MQKTREWPRRSSHYTTNSMNLLEDNNDDDDPYWQTKEALKGLPEGLANEYRRWGVVPDGNYEFLEKRWKSMEEKYKGMSNAEIVAKERADFDAERREEDDAYDQRLKEKAEQTRGEEEREEVVEEEPEEPEGQHEQEQEQDEL